jgi:ComF family protein
MSSFFAEILSWIFPKACSGCRKNINSGSLCNECIKKIKYNSYVPHKIISGIKVYSVSLYTFPVTNLIKAFKYKGKQKAAVFIADLFYQYFLKADINNLDLEIVPVPLHKKRQRNRSYNHMYLVAKELSRLSGFPVNNKLLKRIKNTKPQYELSVVERADNLKEAFKVDKKFYSGKTLLIIDDIFTSGATIAEIISELKIQKIDKIVAVVLSNPKNYSDNFY